MQYLVVPRVIASVLMLPLLVVMGDAVGMYGGYFVAVQLLGANPVTYYDSSFQFLDMDDFTVGLIKAAVFGLILSVVACSRGYYTEGGAEGVGRSTTQAVVVGSLAILLADFFLTRLLFERRALRSLPGARRQSCARRVCASRSRATSCSTASTSRSPGESRSSSSGRPGRARACS